MAAISVSVLVVGLDLTVLSLALPTMAASLHRWRDRGGQRAACAGFPAPAFRAAAAGSGGLARA
jgi:hypothetical protein